MNLGQWLSRSVWCKIQYGIDDTGVSFRGTLELDLDLELHLELDLDLGLDLEPHLDLDSKPLIPVERA